MFGRRNVLILTVLSLLGARASARAQSAADKWDPGLAGNSAAIYAVAAQPNGKTVIGGDFLTVAGTSRKYVARINPDGSLDATFNPIDPNGAVLAVALQPDGKILIGGLFTFVGATPCGRIARLLPSGALDSCFGAGADARVNAIAIQPDNKIVVAGNFSTLAGVARSRIGHFNADATLDGGFNPGTNGFVFALAIQPNGQILAGGTFSMMGGGGIGSTTRNHIARLNGNGTLDTFFNPGANGDVSAIAVQVDGRIVVGGAFGAVGGGTGTTSRSFLARLLRDGSVDPGFTQGTNGQVLAVTMLPDGDILVGGFFNLLANATRFDVGRLNADGTLDAFNPGVNSSVCAAAVQPDGKIVASGTFNKAGGGSTGNAWRIGVARFYDDGSLDDTLNPGASGTPLAFAAEPDGKIVAGGTFTNFGSGATLGRSRLARMSLDGAVDIGFDPGANATVRAILVLPDGRMVVGGDFTQIGGGGSGSTTSGHIARLTATGSVDLAFNPGAGGSVSALALQQDGRILVGGDFTTFGGVSAGGLARLNADGSLGAFPTSANGAVRTIALQPDGKILIGGFFTQLTDTFGTSPHACLARLNADGTIDTSFNASASAYVNAFAVQPDGKIVVAGYFIQLDVTPRKYIGRLNADGSLDQSFNPGADVEVVAVALQPDGSMIVGGYFTALGGGTGVTPRQHLGRLSAAGVVDPAFDPGSNGAVYAMLLQEDGKLLVGGTFVALGSGGTGVDSRARVGRIAATAAASQSIAVTGGGKTLSWARGGTAPQVSRVTFEVSNDGTAFTPVGEAQNVGDWQLPASLPVNQPFFIRARGYASAGFANGSKSIVQSVRSAYVSCATLSPSTLPGGRVGTPYSVGFTAGASIGAATFSQTGALPAGINFTGGVLSGTPTAYGSFPITVSVTDGSSGCATSIAMTLVISSLPTLSLSPSRVNFGAVQTGGGTWTSQTPAQNIAVVQNGAGQVTWTASADQPWISVSPASGSGGGVLSISVVNTGSLPSGAQAGTVTLTTIGAGNYPTVPVLVTIIPSTNGPAIGSFDTPFDGQTGLTGSIGVTGWAVDDVGVSAVHVCRQAVAGEGVSVQPLCGNRAEVFIGNAVLVAGARPDIAAAFPDVPYYDRAGWGYLLLSNFLPNQGNGAYVLSVYAEDYDGLVTLLGTKAIACANATATAPFGAIDTPEQGGVMSGAGFPNFGWVLAAQPTASGRFIPFDGSTIQVFIDSVLVGNVDSYNNARPDIQALFPGYANSSGAVGVKVFDSTTIPNGVHTIFWIATDNFGAAQGIGSRYFTVSNSSVVATATAERGESRAHLSAGALAKADAWLHGDRPVARGFSPATGAAIVDGTSPTVSASADVDRLDRSAAAVQVHHGFDATATARTIAPDGDGVRQIHTAQLARVTIDLHVPSDDASTTYRGYTRDGDTLRALPVGSHLDERTGEFAWAPGLAFGGAHDLVFVKASAHGEERIDIRVTVK